MLRLLGRRPMPASGRFTSPLRRGLLDVFTAPEPLLPSRIKSDRRAANARGHQPERAPRAPVWCTAKFDRSHCERDPELTEPSGLVPIPALEFDLAANHLEEPA